MKFTGWLTGTTVELSRPTACPNCMAPVGHKRTTCPMCGLTWGAPARSAHVVLEMHVDDADKLDMTVFELPGMVTVEGVGR